MAEPWSSLYRCADHQQPPRVLVLAELGVNHNGQLEQALALVHAAAGAGADAVKLQLFDPRHLLSQQAMLADYQRQAGAADPFAMLDELKLSLADMQRVAREARDCNLSLVVTPFSPEDVETLKALAVDAVKIASPDAVNPPLLKAVAALQKPMLVSTGTCEVDELEWVAGLLKRHEPGGILLQCVSSYPTKMDKAGLGGMAVLRERFALPVGATRITPRRSSPGALATAAGACVLEKHLTLDVHADGPDHAASLDPVHFSHYVDLVRQAEAAWGALRKNCQEVEREVRLVSRQSVCAKRDLPAGHKLTGDDLTVRRPGTGIPAKQMDMLLGHRLVRAVAAGVLLQLNDLENF
ncbi:MAG: N-acetylneuraminate synthase [Phycisphaerales bacterium]|nr:N-acetylneuraminate synthase [Phycisphaerales bacterium]